MAFAAYLLTKCNLMLGAATGGGALALLRVVGWG